MTLLASSRRAEEAKEKHPWVAAESFDIRGITRRGKDVTIGQFVVDTTYEQFLCLYVWPQEEILDGNRG